MSDTNSAIIYVMTTTACEQYVTNVQNFQKMLFYFNRVTEFCPPFSLYAYHFLQRNIVTQNMEKSVYMWKRLTFYFSHIDVDHCRNFEQAFSLKIYCTNFIAISEDWNHVTYNVETTDERLSQVLTLAPKTRFLNSECINIFLFEENLKQISLMKMVFT